jgi:hypothetical protein
MVHHGKKLIALRTSYVVLHCHISLKTTNLNCFGLFGAENRNRKLVVNIVYASHVEGS